MDINRTSSEIITKIGEMGVSFAVAGGTLEMSRVCSYRMKFDAAQKHSVAHVSLEFAYCGSRGSRRARQ